MKRLLLYVHYNKYDELSVMCSTNWSNFDHFFSKLIVISNSQTNGIGNINSQRAWHS